jgi:pimeloyl-ACP methyl ester carboxylesterase
MITAPAKAQSHNHLEFLIKCRRNVPTQDWQGKPGNRKSQDLPNLQPLSLSGFLLGMAANIKGMNRMTRLILLGGFVMSICAPLLAAPHNDRIPLETGKLRLHDFNAVICRELHLPACPAGGEIDLKGPDGRDFLFALNAMMWNGGRLELQDDRTLLLQFDSDAVSNKCEALRRLSRIYTAEKAPHATSLQARNWGLLAPELVDSSRPLVVLIHGLDSNRADCAPIGRLLQDDGFQVAYFGYPGDQAIADSAELLGRCLKVARHRFPQMPIELVTHSMGGLVARDYIEGLNYGGEVSQLIMVAPPNAGSSWARLRLLLALQENYYLFNGNSDWHWTWLVTEGLGEAGNDLLPGSNFLKTLNSRPRRADVHYTIIAGNKSSVHRLEGNVAGTISNWIPAKTRNWWGLRHCYAGLRNSADRLHEETGDGDGPVSLTSTRLPGVQDYVVLPADHVSLYLPVNGQPPAAWPVIRSRLVIR